MLAHDAEDSELVNPSWLPEDGISLGPGHFYTKAIMYGTDEWCGIFEWHWNPNKGRWCEGYAPFKPETGWTIVSAEPLTLTPSLQCTVEGCNNHGFITNGRWSDA